MVGDAIDSNLEVSLHDITMCLSNTTDLVSSQVADHQKRVAYIASGVALEMGLSKEVQANLVLAGSLHDFGALSLKERLDCLDFEVNSPHQHSESAFLLLKEFEPYHAIAEFIRHHHLPWDHGEGAMRFGKDVPLESHILHFADRIAVLLHGASPQQIDHLYRSVRPRIGELFAPDVAEAFFEHALRSFFWFDLESPYLATVIQERGPQDKLVLNLEEFAAMGRLFGHAIDFRSRFTAVHSSGTAAVVKWLANKAGMSEYDCRLMSIAGYMHDFGKLAISRELLDKPTALSAEEMDQIKKHPYYAHRLLDPIQCLRKLNEWVAFHHERLDGKGYPFHLKGHDIPLGARVMAVGDIFTAITEDRPYRRGMSPEQALRVLDEMTSEGALDGDIVTMVGRSFSEIDEIRRTTQAEAYGEYEEFSTYLSAALSSTQ